MGKIEMQIKVSNNPNRLYFPGQLVEGQVVITSQKREKVVGVSIHLSGKARVDWKKRKNNGTNHTRMVSYFSNEIYVNSHLSLAENGQSSTIIPEGTSNYPFQFLLPANLPSSFTSFNGYGQVSYILTGNLRRSTFKSDIQTQLLIKVNATLDLNLELDASQPQECTKTTHTNSMFHRSGSITLKMRLPYRSGFVAGDKLHFETEIMNHSHKTVTGLEVSLREIAEFYAQRKIKTTKRTICFVNGPLVAQGESKSWAASLRIPQDVPPTNLGAPCAIIKLKYVVHFKFLGKYLLLKGTFPVVIGTIPLRDTFQNSRPAPSSIPPMTWIEGSSAPPEYDELSAHSFLSNDSLHIYAAHLDPSAPTLEVDDDIPPPDYAEAMGVNR